MTNVLHLTLFGSPAVQYHGQPVTGFRSSKAQALLYYLAVTGRPHTRPTLAGLFWGDQPEAAARTSLSKCLSNLRDLVGDAMLVDRQTVAFNRQQPYHLDTEHFLSGIGQPPTPDTIHVWQAALALYRGDFLEGFYVREAPDFEQWVLGQRAHYREAVLQGLHTLANWHEQGGDLAAAISHTRRLLTLEPWREEAHRQLMTRLARSGQRAAALAQFESCRRTLNEELAVEPDAETIAVVEAIRSGDVEKVMWRQPRSVTLSSPKYNLPMPPTPLLGREDELVELAKLLRNPTQRLITIFGAGGIGKTRLAVAAAAQQAVNFRHGAVFVTLAAITNPTFLPQAILQAFDQLLQGNQNPQTQLLTYLNDQEVLVVLDNYEQLLPTVGLLTDLLTHAPGVKLLVTSRERLALQAEWVFPIEGLSYPLAHTPGPVEELAAIQLFCQRVRQFQRHFQPSGEELAAIVYICQVTEGLPLAIELAAASRRIQSCREIAMALAGGQYEFTSTMRDIPARHRTVRTTIDHSWLLLSPPEQRVFGALSVFRGGFEFEAAQTVTGATQELITALVDKALVRYEPSGRYSLHELVRQYASEKLDQAGAKEAIVDQHCRFYLNIITIAELEWYGPKAQQWFDRLECDHDNIRAALFNALGTNSAVALRLAAMLWEFWYLRGYYNEARSWLQQALAQKTSVPVAVRAKALQGAGRLAFIQGDYHQATVQLEESLALFKQLENWRGVVDSLNFLASAELLQSNLNHAHALLAEALRLCQVESNHRVYATTIAYSGMVALYQGDYHQAKTLLTEGLTRCYAMEDAIFIENLISNLGYVELYLGSPSAAILYFTESLAMGLQQHNPEAITWGLEGIAEAFYQCGIDLTQTQKAVCLLSAADKLRRNLNTPLHPIDRPYYDRNLSGMRTQLTDTDFAKAWAEGAAMSLEEAVTYALAHSTNT